MEPTALPLTSRGRRCELLAAASRADLVALAGRCSEPTGPGQVVTGPTVGVVMLTVREPVEATRFHLGEVLVTRAEVVHRGQRGWAVRLGDDPEGAVAAAVCDAEAASDGPCRADIDDLCRRVERAAAQARAAEWAELTPTVVAFEELS